MEGVVSTWWQSGRSDFEERGKPGFIITVSALLIGGAIFLFSPDPELTFLLLFFDSICFLSGVCPFLAFGNSARKGIAAIRRFRNAFGFFPATTEPGRRALQTKVEEVLTRKAQALAGVYQEEENLQRELRKEGLTAQQILELERQLRGLEPQKRLLRDLFYSARDAARSSRLPKPFHVRDRFKDYRDYLPVEEAAR